MVDSMAVLELPQTKSALWHWSSYTFLLPSSYVVLLPADVYCGQRPVKALLCVDYTCAVSYGKILHGLIPRRLAR